MADAYSNLDVFMTLGVLDGGEHAHLRAGHHGPLNSGKGSLQASGEYVHDDRQSFWFNKYKRACVELQYRMLVKTNSCFEASELNNQPYND